MRVAFYIVVVLAAAVGVSAHPLGNFSVNQYTGIAVGKGDIRILQVLDLAEIPTLQTVAAIDTDKDGRMSQSELAAYMSLITPEYAANLSMSAGGVQLPLAVVRQTPAWVADA